MSNLVVSVSERNMLRAVFAVMSGIGEVSTEDVIEIAALTEALDLEKAEETVNKMEEEVQYARLLEQRKLREIAVEMDKLEEAKEVIPPKLYTKFDKQQQVVNDMPASVSYGLLLDVSEALEYTVDKSTVNWLHDALKEYKWNQTLSRDQQGRIEAINRSLAPDEARVAAALIRAVKKAM